MRLVSRSGLDRGSVQLLSMGDSIILRPHGELELAGPHLIADDLRLTTEGIRISLYGEVTTLQNTVGYDLKDSRPTLLDKSVLRIGSSATIAATIAGTLVVLILRYLAIRAGRST